MKKYFWILIVVAFALLIIAGVYFWSNRSDEESVKTTKKPNEQVVATPSSKTGEKSESAKPTQFENIKSPHFVSSTPENNTVLTSPPSQVTINFNFDLAAGSKIKVTADGSDITTQQGTTISSDNLSMRTLINPIEPASYKVGYTACWPDGSCHNGSFGFTVE